MVVLQVTAFRGISMVDLRQRVEEDRGLLKKIQSAVPGFRGYRAREDIRAADNYLRMQIADKIVSMRRELENCRSILVDNYATENLDKLGALINRFQTVEGKVRHAEQGYSGISANIQVKEEELDRLYEFDYSLLSHIGNISSAIPSLRNAATSDNSAEMRNEISAIDSIMGDFENTFAKRMGIVTGTLV